MFNDGLIEETKLAVKKGWGKTKVMQSMTYNEVQEYLDGKITLEECVALVQLEHRKYAKRQITWFKKNNSI
jgi:tRNA dimethylallyltransferase